MNLHLGKLGDLLTTVAPSLASAIGGPLAASAVSAIEYALGHKSNQGDAIPARLDELTAAAQSITPEQLAAIRKADQDFTLQMQQAGFQNTQAIAQLSFSDRDSARTRETVVHDSTPRILAYIACLGALVVATLALFHKLPGDNSLVGMILGYLFSEAKTCSAYYFGASPGN